MSDMIELNLDDMEQVTGGELRTVNTGTAQRAGIWKKFEDISNKAASDGLANDTVVNTIGDPKYVGAKDRSFIEIEYMKKGKKKKGWIAASILGIKGK